jgi:predicted dehydrogenase
MTTPELRWGVLGCASIANALIPAIRAVPGNRVEAVASRSPDKARAFAEAWGLPKAFGSYADLLASGVVDVIYNPLPNSLHAEWTVRALEAGLPVLCEKPLTVTAAEARGVAEASARTGVPAAEAVMYRFHPLYEALTRALAEGVIGDLTAAAARFTFRLDDRSQVPAAALLGGGALLDVGTYPVTLLRWIFGAEPTRVTANGRFTLVDDTVVGLLEFPNGGTGTLEVSIESEERQSAELTGTKGAIFLDRPWFPGREGAGYRLLRDGHETFVPVPGGDGYELEVADFAEVVRTGRPPRFGLDDSVATMAVLDALRGSACVTRSTCG